MSAGKSVMLGLAIMLFALAASGDDKLPADMSWRPEIDREGASPGRWTMDLKAASKVALEKDIPILLNFVGSDWCKYCKLAAEKVFNTREWESYVGDRMMLVDIDLPRDPSLLPADVLSRNRSLSAKFGVRGYPTFLILDSDGKTVLKKFGFSGGGHPYRFMKETETGLRSRPGSVSNVVANLGERESGNYKSLLRQLNEVDKRLRDWLAANPKATPANQARFEMMSAEVAKLTRAVETIELGVIAGRFSGAEDAKGDHLLRSKAYMDKIGELRAAHTELEDWLLGRPELNKGNSAEFDKKMQRLAQILSALSQIE